MSRKFVAASIPNIFCFSLFFFQHTVDILTAGHLGDPVQLAAIGLGNLIQSCLFFAPIIGLNLAIEVLGSQAVGAGNLELAGIHHNRGRIVIVISLAILFLVCTYTKEILISIG
jgi:Na+-driven multidrug efflux pump